VISAAGWPGAGLHENVGSSHGTTWYIRRCTGILYGGVSEIVLVHHLPVELGGKKSTRSLVFSIVNAISYRHTDPLSLTSIYLLLLSGRSINSSSYMHLCLLSPLR